MPRLSETCDEDHYITKSGDDSTTISCTIIAHQIMSDLVIYYSTREICNECGREFSSPVRIFEGADTYLGTGTEEVGAAIANVLAR